MKVLRRMLLEGVAGARSFDGGEQDAPRFLIDGEEEATWRLASDTRQGHCARTRGCNVYLKCCRDAADLRSPSSLPSHPASIAPPSLPPSLPASAAAASTVKAGRPRCRCAQCFYRAVFSFRPLMDRPHPRGGQAPSKGQLTGSCCERNPFNPIPSTPHSELARSHAAPPPPLPRPRRANRRSPHGPAVGRDLPSDRAPCLAATWTPPAPRRGYSRRIVTGPPRRFRST